jgi:hypothetical protein
MWPTASTSVSDDGWQWQVALPFLISAIKFQLSHSRGQPICLGQNPQSIARRNAIFNGKAFDRLPLETRYRMSRKPFIARDALTEFFRSGGP